MGIRMIYRLNNRYRLRGWHKLPTGLYDMARRRAAFIDYDPYTKILMKCDGESELDVSSLDPQDKEFLDYLIKEKIVNPAKPGENLLPEQRYHAYPARYRESVHWSITGACNLKCRHCFMSAPHAKHGVPSHVQIVNIIEQIADCGIFKVELTGGEPLVREDFESIIEELAGREIAVATIYTNGSLVDDKLLDILERYRMHPSFQLSFDGIGQHDFLRGVPGAEHKVIEALKLLHSRGYRTSCAMSLHRKNKDTIRETVKLMTSLGVSSIKIGSMMDLGEWASPELDDLHLTQQEALEIIEQYIPLYFEDDAPVSIMLSGAFLYDKDSGRNWGIYYRRECPREKEDYAVACPSLKSAFYIGADGVVAPCQGMCDTPFVKHFPSLKEHTLSEILCESDYVKYSYTMVGDVRRGNSECVKCEYIDRCAGGCRNAALLAGGDYYSVDPEVCYFYKNGWEERIKAAAQPAYEDYLRRNTRTSAQDDTGDLIDSFCK